MSTILNTNSESFNPGWKSEFIQEGFFDKQQIQSFSPNKMTNNHLNSFFNQNATGSKSYRNDQDNISTCGSSETTSNCGDYEPQLQNCCKSLQERKQLPEGTLLTNLSQCQFGKCCKSVQPRQWNHIKKDKLILYKTKLCEHLIKWLKRTGNDIKNVDNFKCKYTFKCQYAHGLHELRKKHFEEPNPKNPNYKTKRCKKGSKCQFHLHGTCKYMHDELDFNQKKSPALNTSTLCTPCPPSNTNQAVKMIQQSFKAEILTDDDETVDTNGENDELDNNLNSKDIWLAGDIYQIDDVETDWSAVIDNIFNGEDF